LQSEKNLAATHTFNDGDIVWRNPLPPPPTRVYTYYSSRIENNYSRSKNMQVIPNDLTVI